ncbi:uncharacterized protein LOC123678937 [Harmonia axyridis]|uniref:uncharacterized protein LOC123678937 n=1 Tax=Harmonia axyridis TaxID=115357 RepID=UPI001E278090|nr:uncharacterized protein LOC123678937 [Harmonia axyridis]
MSFLILALFFLNYENFLKHVRRLKIYKFGVPPECAVFAKRVDIFTIASFYGCRVACAIYVFLTYFDDKFCKNSGLAGDAGYVCNLPFPLWFPFKVNTFGIEQILLMSIIILASFYFPVLCSLTTMPLAACGFTFRRLRTLRKIMMKYTSTGGCTEALHPSKLRFFLEYHEEILDCVQKMNDDVGYCHVPFIFFMPILLALYLNKLIEQKDPAALVALFPWFFTTTTLCSFGEHLEYERYSLYLVLTDILWYRMDTKLRKVYYMSLCKFQQPFHLKIKSVSYLNNIFLYKILKGTYTFLVYFSNGKKDI